MTENILMQTGCTSMVLVLRGGKGGRGKNPGLQKLRVYRKKSQEILRYA